MKVLTFFFLLYQMYWKLDCLSSKFMVLQEVLIDFFPFFNIN